MFHPPSPENILRFHPVAFILHERTPHSSKPSLSDKIFIHGSQVPHILREFRIHPETSSLAVGEVVPIPRFPHDVSVITVLALPAPLAKKVFP